jgi:hypothetical protein
MPNGRGARNANTGIPDSRVSWSIGSLIEMNCKVTHMLGPDCSGDHGYLLLILSKRHRFEVSYTLQKRPYLLLQCPNQRTFEIIIVNV